MDQGAIATFKAYYIRRTFSQAIEVTMGENTISLTDFWKNYNVRNATDNIDLAWSEHTVSKMRAVWKNILPHCSNDFVGFEPQVEKVVENIVQIGKELGFQNVDNENVHDWINFHSGELYNETLVETDQ